MSDEGERDPYEGMEYFYDTGMYQYPWKPEEHQNETVTNPASYSSCDWMIYIPLVIGAIIYGIMIYFLFAAGLYLVGALTVAWIVIMSVVVIVLIRKN